MSRQTLHNMIFSLVLTGLFAGLVFNVFSLPFAFGDDHRIIAMNHPELMEPAYIQTLHNNDPGLAGTLLNDARLGRFRPLGWTITKVQSVVFGDNATAWRVFNIVILFFSLLTFAGICRKLRLHSAVIFTILLVYVFGKNNETWWTLIPPAQNIGELFLLAGFLCWLFFRQKGKQPYKVMALILFFAAALVKESFIFCIPFVWLADFFFFSPEKKLFTKNYFWLWLTFLIPFVSLACAIIFSKTVYSYAYSDSLLSILAFNAKEFLISSVFLLAPIAMFFNRDYVISRRNLVKLAVFMFSWLIIQLILLKGIKMNGQHHYLIPGLLPVLLLSALSLHFIRQKTRTLYLSLIVFYFLFALYGAKNTFVNSGYYAAQIKSYYKMIHAIKENDPQNIYYVSPGAVAGDWLMGTSAILRSEGISSPLIFCSTSDSVTVWEKKFLATRPALKFPRADLKTLKPGKGDWLINVEEPEVYDADAMRRDYNRGLLFALDTLRANKVAGLEESYLNISLRDFPAVRQKKKIEFVSLEIK